MIITAGHAPRRGQRGFTLIEVLVTLVLVSVGLLGVAALQMTSLRGNQEAYVRSQASVLAGDILDRMRANPVAFRNNQYTVDFNGTGVGTTTTAGRDLAAWQLAIDTLLPGGAMNAAGRIERNFDVATRRHIVTVTIRWSERAEVATNRAADNAVTFQTRSEI